MVRVEIKGVHRVVRRLADGSTREHHYAWRGGPNFWSSDADVVKNSPAYVAALAAVATRPKPSRLPTPDLVDAYLSSAEFRSKKPRTQADYRKWALRFARAFAADPAEMFEDPDSRGEVNDWRSQWAHSPKQFDYAGTVATIILTWAQDAGKIRQHHVGRLRKVYESDRAEIVWTPSDLEKFNGVAPEWARRVLGVACETGLRPGDLIKLTRQHVEITPRGRRLKIRTNKRGRVASIPVTPTLAQILDATPPDRMLVAVNAHGRPLTAQRASEGVRQWRDKAGLSDVLRLQDARGTAATRLLRAGCSLNQIAAHMAWSLRHAANVIERYASVSPDDADEVLTLLAIAKGAER